MKISDIRVFVGANLYHKQPVCRLQLEPDTPTEVLTSPIPPPLLKKARHVIDEMGVPTENEPEDSTNIGDLMLSLIHAIAFGLNWSIDYSEVLPGHEENTLEVIFTYEERTLAKLISSHAVQLLKLLYDNRRSDAAVLSQTLQQKHGQFLEEITPVAPQVDVVYKCRMADKKGIPWLLTDGSLVTFGHGCRRQVMRRNMTMRTSFLAFQNGSNKPLANRLMGSLGLPVPRLLTVNDRSGARRAAALIGYPVVVKPATTDLGVGVTVGVMNDEALSLAFENAKLHASSVVIEAFIPGDEHRLLVVNGKLEAVARRIPAHVIGDGVHSIRDLVVQLNSDPRRKSSKLAELSPVVIDAETTTLLAENEWSLGSVPRAGEQVNLKKTSNLSRGGTSINLTDETHPDNKKMAVDATMALGLDIAGVDFITPDITRSWRDVGGGICEINPNPGLRMHYAPGHGEPLDVSEPIFRMLFPEGVSPRVPIIAVTGSNGKTTTTRLCGHVLKEAGSSVGMTTTDGVYVDGEQIRQGDLSGGPAAEQLLRDPRIDAAVLEIARGAILKLGTGIDRSDVTIVTSIADEHLGELNIETPEDLANAKGLLVELAQEMVVLNADEPLTAALAERSRARRICYVTMQPDNPLVKAHIGQRMPAVCCEKIGDKQWLVLYDAGERHEVLEVQSLGHAMGGAIAHNVQNTMYAVAAAYGLGVDPDIIAKALSCFKNDYDHNPGRMNEVAGLPYRLFVDICHNRHSLAAITPVTDEIAARRRVLVYSMPGNRREVDYHRSMEAAAGHFDEFHLYPLSEYYLRGRPAKELTAMLADGLRQKGVDEQKIREHDSREAAIEQVLETSQENDLVFVASLEYKEAWAQIHEHIAQSGQE